MTFDPIQFGFVELRDFRIANTVPVYEYKITQPWTEQRISCASTSTLLATVPT